MGVRMCMGMLLRMLYISRLQTRLADLHFQKLSYQAALTTLNSLLRELRKLDDKQLLVDIQVVAQGMLSLVALAFSSLLSHHGYHLLPTTLLEPHYLVI